MDADTVRHRFLILSGAIVLYVGWGNALTLLIPGGPLCGIRDPTGLHLDASLQLVYANSHCPLVVYDHAWVVFLSLSVVGLSAVIGGVRSIRRTPG